MRSDAVEHIAEDEFEVDGEAVTDGIGSGRMMTGRSEGVTLAEEGRRWRRAGTGGAGRGAFGRSAARLGAAAEPGLSQATAAEIVEEGVPAEIDGSASRHDVVSPTGPSGPPEKSSPEVTQFCRCTSLDGHSYLAIRNRKSKMRGPLTRPSGTLSPLPRGEGENSPRDRDERSTEPQVQGSISTTRPLSTSWNVGSSESRSTMAKVRDESTTGIETTEPGLMTSPAGQRNHIGL